jgi:peptidase M41-like protein
MSGRRHHHPDQGLIIDAGVLDELDRQAPSKADLLDEMQREARDEAERQADDHRRPTVYHEAGHALVAVLAGVPLVRVMIKAIDGRYDGFTYVGPGEYALTAYVACCMAGIAAELIVFNATVSFLLPWGDGANDIEDAALKASRFPDQLATFSPVHHPVAVNGMARRIASIAGVCGLKGALDPRVVRFLADRALVARDTLNEHRAALDALAAALLERGELAGDEVTLIVKAHTRDRIAGRGSVSSNFVNEAQCLPTHSAREGERVSHPAPQGARTAMGPGSHD